MAETTGMRTWLIEPAAVEVLSVDDVKLALGIDFADHDERLKSLVFESRGLLERFLGLTIAPCKRAVSWRSLSGEASIPYGPITAITSKPDEATVTDGPYPSVVGEFPTGLTIEYEAGSYDLEPHLKALLLDMVSERFLDPMATAWKSKAKPYRKLWAL